MNKPMRGRTNRVANARLPVFLASSLPEAVKARVAAAVAELLGLRVKDPKAVVPPGVLIELQTMLPVSIAVVSDLLHVLCMGKPHLPGHTRQALGALLRVKRRRLGRNPTGTDFPPNHPMQLFSCAYWGGIEAWASGAPDRVQRPKGFWRTEANQIQALRAFAAAHPETPITAATLQRAGYHALSMALPAADLDERVAKAGLGRQLKYHPDGQDRWDADAIVDAYIAVCREWGTTLSTEGLLKLKGSTSSLRFHARRVFGQFGAMVDAARLRAPDLKPLKSYVAADGTRLDSNSEVVAWNALRRALPDADLRAHVILPGSRRSVDVLVNESVYVEVLMISTAAMPRPTSKAQAKYALQWDEKMSLYALLGIAPVLIEPDDIYHPARLAQCMAEIGRRIGMEPRPPTLSLGLQTRAKGFWDYKALCNAVAEVAGLVGSFPTYAHLAAHGYGHAATLLRERGMRQRVAETLGLTLINSRGVWNRKRVVEELLAWVKTHGHYPTKSELIRAGRLDLVGARSRFARGAQEAVRAEVESLWGQPLPRRRRQAGCYISLASIADLLRPLAESLGRVPTQRECGAAGLGAAWGAMSCGWGVAAFARHLGVPVTSRGRRAQVGPRLL